MRLNSGLTADEFGALPRNEQLAIFLEWCAAIALEGARIGVRILCRAPLEVERN